MGVRLVAEGCGAHLSGPGPRWSDADRTSYANWQRRLGYTGADAGGPRQPMEQRRRAMGTASRTHPRQVCGLDRLHHHRPRGPADRLDQRRSRT
ncbi:peptidoglycan-binding protein [Micromonospora sp. NPDC050200]|uniref:peptidoglycan-binding protein n=1 Tax=Micromonospora sp. NPDC050200 TaxID=3155664 RepID=UPI0033DEB6AA